MAFQQPIQRPARRVATPPPITTTAQQPKESQQVEESQEWVLFSPQPPSVREAQDDSPAALYTATPITPRTNPKSRLSDFGSLESAVVSARHRDQQSNEEEEEDEQDDDDDEADSLDDGLHAFNEPTSVSNPSAHQCLDSSIADALLPTHDGLGGFNGNNAPLQQQIWQHERYNPRRAARGSTSLRRSEVQKRLDALSEAEKSNKTARDPAEERNIRIEKWRLDQSRAIVEEIERETRRRRRRSKLSQSSIQKPVMADEDASKEYTTPTAEPLPSQSTQPVAPNDESLWTRTSRLIRELIGVDDATLSYIFGEAKANAVTPLPVSATANANTPSDMIAYAEQTVPDSLAIIKSSSWETNLIARIGRELGSLVYQFSEHPPNTFSTYMRVQETVPYAGLPTPSELSTPAGFLQFNPPPSSSRPVHHLKHRRRMSVARTDPSLFGIEEEPTNSEGIEEDNDLTPQQTRRQQVAPLTEDAQGLKQEKAYWERDLDFAMIFSYIKSRLRRRSSHSTPRSVNTAQSTAPTFSTAAATGPDALRRAALIRHHHPLVSRNLNALRASSLSNLNVQASQLPSTPLSPVLGRRSSSLIDDGASSCASQSTKRSKTHHSGSLSISSSRNYWDIGGPSWGEA